jgi:hypothetical protein
VMSHEFDEETAVPNGTYEIEIVIDAPVAKVWQQFLDIGSWVTSHKIEEVGDLRRTLGALTRVSPREDVVKNIEADGPRSAASPPLLQDHQVRPRAAVRAQDLRGKGQELRARGLHRIRRHTVPRGGREDGTTFTLLHTQVESPGYDPQMLIDVRQERWLYSPNRTLSGRLPAGLRARSK